MVYAFGDISKLIGLYLIGVVVAIATLGHMKIGLLVSFINSWHPLSIL